MLFSLCSLCNSLFPNDNHPHFYIFTFLHVYIFTFSQPTSAGIRWSAPTIEPFIHGLGENALSPIVYSTILRPTSTRQTCLDSRHVLL